MAHYSGRRPRGRSNPDLFGEDIGNLAWEAVGIGTTAVVNDKLLSPLVRNFMPGASSGNAMAKAIDAVTTAVSAWVTGEAVHFVSFPIGRKMKRGGMVLAVAKGISIFIPGFSLSASLPVPASLNIFNAPAVTNGNGKTPVALPVKRDVL